MSPRTKTIIPVTLLAFGGIVIASIFWATSGTVAKLLFGTFDPFAIAFFRTATASLFLLPLFWKMNTHKFTRLMRDVLPVALAFTINFLFFYVGVSKTTANAAAIIYVGTPLIAALIAHFFIGERTTRQKTAGIFVGLVGSILILVLPAFEKGKGISGDLGGNIYIALATVSWALYTVGSRRLSTQKQYSPIIITSISTFICALTFLAIVISMPHKTNILLSFLTPHNLLWFVYLAFFVTVVTNYLFQWAIKHSSTLMATLTHYLQPVFAFIFNSLLLGEQLTPGMIAGSIIIMVGVFLATGTGMMRMAKILRKG